jgi:hypothetical protein
MHARRIGSALDRALLTEASIALQKELGAFASAKPTN